MRQLIHVPIVHGQTDLGPIRERVHQAYIAKGGEQAWHASRKAVAEFWNAVENVMDSISLDFRKVRLYQDGLPVCGQEARLVRDLAEQGGANYRILQKLCSRGAAIEGTEDPDLLRREFELMMTGSTAGGTGGADDPASRDNAAIFRNLLQDRDRFIAQRIDATLRQGEIGILFLGALHGVVAMLPPTIEVLSLSEFLCRSGAFKQNKI